MRFFRLLAIFWMVSQSSDCLSSASIAFYYGQIDSVRELINYDRVVVDPSYLSPKQLRELHNANTKVFAYLSVGEYSGDVIPDSLQDVRVGTNRVWQSQVMDLSSPKWQQFLLNQTIEFRNLGYDGIFLDTLDSYSLFSDEDSNQVQKDSLVKTINQLGQKIVMANKGPFRLILNRGFEVLNELSVPIDAVVAESLYSKFSVQDGIYETVDETDTLWLKKELDQVKSKNIEVIVIDYLSPFDRDNQRKAAKKIIKLGYTPYVSDGLLGTFGVSFIEPIAKRVLGFYDGNNTDISLSKCHRLVSMPLEYKGYVPDCQDINQFDWSKVDPTRYAAAIFWFGDNVYNENNRILDWLVEAHGKIAILFIESMPTTSRIEKLFGIKRGSDLTGELHLVEGDAFFGQNIPVFSPFELYPRWSVIDGKSHSLIQISDDKNQRSSLYIKADWGAAVFSPLPVRTLGDGQANWLLDPFELLDNTLSLPVIPVADITTESGRRIQTIHIDGDGFISKGVFPNQPYVSEMILNEILRKSDLPHTVSVIQGEISKEGLYPEKSVQFENIARQMYLLPNVEAASHTFSHPFYWNLKIADQIKVYGEHLPIPGYTMNYEKEIVGSTQYINNELLPKGKKVKVVLWSGAANPTAEVLDISERIGVLNVNGGSTYTVKGNNDLTQISPAIMWHENAVQVYSPVQNENLHTNLWHEYFDGYLRVIESFELLNEPHRLKPVSIYYHMYSGSYPVSLNAIKQIYDWTSTQKLTPLYLSEYAMRAKSFYETGIAKDLEGHWIVTSTGVRSARLPYSLGKPNLINSNIAGWVDEKDGRYVTLNQTKSLLNFEPSKRQAMFFSNANAKMTKWSNTNGKTKWSFDSHIPLEFEVENGTQCQMKSDQIFIRSENGERTRFNWKASGIITGTITCDR